MLIGRENEIETLMGCYESGRPEFIAVIGRRRVGKTFLVKELLESKFTFYSTAKSHPTSGLLVLSEMPHRGGFIKRCRPVR